MKPSLEHPRLTVVVPTYNEAANLAELVRRVAAVVPGAEILVVDDGSPDGTARVARDLAGYGVRVIERMGERGLATAVLRGIAEARSDLCVVMDADLSHPPEAIPRLVAAVEEGGAEVAVGSRYVPGGQIEDWPLWRRAASWAGTLLARPLVGVRDPMAGYFCLRRSLLEGVELRPQGFKILLEILARTRVRRVAEVPIRFEDRAAGKSKFGARQRREFLRQVARLYWELNAWPARLVKFGAVGAGVGLLWAGLGEVWGAEGFAPACARFLLGTLPGVPPWTSWAFGRRGAGKARRGMALVAGAAAGGAVHGALRALDVGPVWAFLAALVPVWGMGEWSLWVEGRAEAPSERRGS